MRAWHVMVVFALAAVLLVGCQQVRQNPAPAPLLVQEQESSVEIVVEEGGGAGTQPPQTEQTADSPQVIEFEMIAKQWEFDPDTITVNKGDSVRLVVRSIDVTHGFLLPEFGVNEVLEPGDDVVIEFIADKQGTFTFACSVPCGSGHGAMRGQLIVQ